MLWNFKHSPGCLNTWHGSSLLEVTIACDEKKKKKVDIKQIFDIIPPCKKLHYLEKDDMSGTFNLGNNAKIQQEKC